MAVSRVEGMVTTRVAACLSPAMTARLRLAIPHALACDSSTRLLVESRADRFGLVVADPTLERGRCADALVEMRERYPSTDVVVYTALTAPVLPQLVRLARHGIAEVIVLGHDDASRRFTQLLS